jgi:hypothetical protein
LAGLEKFMSEFCRSKGKAPRFSINQAFCRVALGK